MLKKAKNRLEKNLEKVMRSIKCYENENNCKLFTPKNHINYNNLYFRSNKKDHSQYSDYEVVYNINSDNYWLTKEGILGRGKREDCQGINLIDLDILNEEDLK